MHENEHDIQPSREDRTNGVRPVLKRQEVLEILLANGAAETEGCNADADPGELVRDADDVLQPGPELACADVAGAEAEAADDGGGQDGYPWDLEAVEMAEKAGCVAVDGEAIEES